jgi:hypothetical protein
VVENCKYKKRINEDLVVLPTEEAEKTFNEKWVAEINNYISAEGQPTITLQRSGGYTGVSYKNVFITKALLRPTDKGFSEIVFTVEENLRDNKRAGAGIIYLNDFFKLKDKVSLKTRVSKRPYKGLSDLSPVPFINLLNNLAEEKLTGYEERKGKSATAILTRLRDKYSEEDKTALREPLLDSIESITFGLPYGEDQLTDIFPDAEGKVEKDLEAAYNKFQTARDIFFKKYGLNENSFNQEKATLGKNIDLTWRYVFTKDDDGKLTKPADTSYGYTLWGRSGVVKFNKPINQLDPVVKELLAEVGKDVSEDEDISAENKKQRSPNAVSSIALCDFIILDVFGGNLDFLRNKNNNDRI